MTDLRKNCNQEIDKLSLILFILVSIIISPNCFSNSFSKASYIGASSLSNVLKINLQRDPKKILDAHAAAGNEMLLPLIDELAPVNRFDYDQSPGIEFYLSPIFLKFIENNIDTILEKNGYSPSSYYIYQRHIQYEEMSLDDLISNQKTLNSAKSIRKSIKDALKRVPIKNNHQFEIDINGIDLSGHWKNFGLKVLPGPEESETIHLSLDLEADRLELNLSSLRLRDLKHSFLGDLGGDNLYIRLGNKSDKTLNVSIPIDLEASNGEIKVHVKDIISNIDDITLEAGWSKNLLLPTVEVTIGSQTGRAKKSKIELEVRKQIPRLMKTLQEYLSEYFTNKASIAIEKKLNNTFKRGYRDLYKLEPFWAPEKELESLYSSGEFDRYLFPNAYLLGFKIDHISQEKGHVKISLDAFMEDGKEEKNSQLAPRAEVSVKPKFLDNDGYDVAASVNIGIINKYIQLSCNRGYFKKAEVGEELVRVKGCPYIYINKKEKEIRLVTTIIQKPEGFLENFLVHDPMEVTFEIGMKLELQKNGQYDLIMTKIDEDSMILPEKFIKKKLFKTTIRNKVKDILSGMNKEYANTKLYEKLPLPNIIGGIPLKNIGIELDKRGHIILYFKTIL